MAVNDARFARDLEASNEAVLAVAAYLDDQGFPVTRPPGYDLPGPDQGDLYVGDKRIEVKQRIEPKFHDFTSRDDYPYGDVLVCETYRFDDAFPQPYAIFNVNGALTHAVAAYASSSNHWVKRWAYDHRYEREGRFYYAPFRVCKFVDLRIA